MITDELRAVAAKTECANGRCERLYRGDLDHIADRIDAEHQKALDEWKAKHGQMWLRGYAECHAELLEGNETLAADLESCGWIRLPKDADGEYVHIGDVMEIDGEVLPPVSGIGNGSVIVGVFGVDKDDDISEVFSLDLMRHHRPDTWERIIEDAIIYAVSDTKGDRARFDALVARCRALAGDAE